MNRLDEIRERAEAARHLIDEDMESCLTILSGCTPVIREDILYLLGEIERLREEAARIEYDEEGFCPDCGRYAKPGPDGERLGQMGWHADKCHIARVLGRQTNSMRLDEQQFKRTEDIGDAAPTALEAQP
jgi:hypothetical protein